MERIKMFVDLHIWRLIMVLALVGTANGWVQFLFGGGSRWAWISSAIAWAVVLVVSASGNLNHKTIQLNEQTIDLQSALINNQQKYIDYLKKESVL